MVFAVIEVDIMDILWSERKELSILLKKRERENSSSFLLSSVQPQYSLEAVEKGRRRRQEGQGIYSKEERVRGGKG